MIHMSKTFVHTHVAVVVRGKLIAAFDLRRRDVDAKTAFSYFVKRQQNFTSVVASKTALDVSFKNDALESVTRLQVFDAANSCERCAAKRGTKHEAYCDASVQTVAQSEQVESVSALDLLDTLKIAAKASSSVKSDKAASASKSSDKAKAASASKSSASKSNATTLSNNVAAKSSDASSAK
jgi:hypothetical protein